MVDRAIIKKVLISCNNIEFIMIFMMSVSCMGIVKYKEGYYGKQ